MHFSDDDMSDDKFVEITNRNLHYSDKFTDGIAFDDKLVLFQGTSTGKVCKKSRGNSSK